MFEAPWSCEKCSLIVKHSKTRSFVSNIMGDCVVCPNRGGECDCGDGDGDGDGSMRNSLRAFSLAEKCLIVERGRKGTGVVWYGRKGKGVVWS